MRWHLNSTTRYLLIKFYHFIREIYFCPFDQGDQGFPDQFGPGRTTRQVIVDLYHLMAWIDLVKHHGQLFVIRNNVFCIGSNRGPGQVGFPQAFLDGDPVPHGRESAHYGTFTYRYQDVAVLSEILQDVNVFTVGTSSLNKADITLFGKFFNIIDR